MADENDLSLEEQADAEIAKIVADPNAYAKETLRLKRERVEHVFSPAEETR